MNFQVIGVLIIVFCLQSFSKTLETNSFNFHDAPEWLKRTRTEKVTDRIQGRLEWTIRKIAVYYIKDQNEFERKHGLGPLPRAVTVKRPNKQEIFLGPQVNQENFDWIFGHELVHIIIYQKYKDAIPKWLEEGLANHLAKKIDKIDYKWLASKPFPKDVRQMNHPLSGTKEDVIYHYTASQALAEMLEKKCDLENLIRLSVERKMENYIETYCEIKDLNKAFKEWVIKQSTK